MSSATERARERIGQILDEHRQTFARSPESREKAIDAVLRAAADAIPALEREERSEALMQAVASQRKPETGAEIVTRAEELLAFLRGQRTRSAEEELAWQAGRA